MPSTCPSRKARLELKANMEGGHKLQDQSACPNNGFSGNAQVSCSFSYGLMLTHGLHFSHCLFLTQASDTSPLLHRGAVTELPHPQHPWDGQGEMLAVVSYPKNIHSHGEKRMGANITGAELSPKPCCRVRQGLSSGGSGAADLRSRQIRSSRNAEGTETSDRRFKEGKSWMKVRPESL